MPSRQDNSSLLVLPLQLKKFSDTFLIKEVGKLPQHHWGDYIIDLEEG